MEKDRKSGRMEGLSSSKGGEQSYCGKQKIDKWSRSEKVGNAMKKKTVAFILLSCFSPVSSLSSLIVIDPDSDNECYTYEKKAKILKTDPDGKNVEHYNVKPTIQGPPIVISDDDDDDDKNSNDLEDHNNKSNDSEVPKDKSNDSEVPKGKSNGSDVPKNDGHDSDVPDDDDDHDSDVPDDDDDHDSDVPDDDDDHDSDVSDDDDHDSDVSDDDDNDDSDFPDDDHDSDAPDNDDGHDSDVSDEDSDDADVPNDSNDWEVPDNNSDDLEVPVPAEDLCDKVQIASDEEELDEAGEQDLGENLCDPPSDPEANLKVSKRKLPTEEEPAPVVEQSGKRKAKSETIVEPLRKRKAKTKNISVTPADKGHKCGHSKKKPGAAKVENRKTRTRKYKVPGSFLHGLGKSRKYSGKKLERNKDDPFNRTNSDKKLQEKQLTAWNNKMLKTAGSYSTGEMPYQNRQCFAEIQIGVKVLADIRVGVRLSAGSATTPNRWMLGASSMSSARHVWSWRR
nr:acidic repeat-containing protein [Aotus nancymaae]